MIKTNKQFISKYNNYVDVNDKMINSGEERFFSSKYRSFENFGLATSLFIFPCFILSVIFSATCHIFFPLTFFTSLIILGTFSYALKYILYFTSKNIRTELKLEKFIFTGNLEDIFNSNDASLQETLKEQKCKLLSDIKEFNGIKGTTILNIYNNTLLKRHILLKESLKEKEKLEKIDSLSDNCKHIINEIQSINDFRNLQHYEEAIADSEKEAYRLKELLDNIPEFLSHEEKNRLQTQYTKELDDRNIHLKKMRVEAQKRIDAKEYFYSNGI